MTSALPDLVRVQIEPSAVEVPQTIVQRKRLGKLGHSHAVPPASFSTNPTAHFINFLHYLPGPPVGMPRKIPRE